MVIVQKFGGTSVGSADAMAQAAELVQAELPRAPLVVLSAMSGTTDTLFRAAQVAVGGDLAGARDVLAALVDRHRAAAAEGLGADDAEFAAELERHREELDVLLHGVSLLRELSRRIMDGIASHGEFLSTAMFARSLQRRGLDAELIDVRAVMRTDATFGVARPQRAQIAELAQAHLLPRLRPGRVVVTQGYVGATGSGQTTTLGRGGSDYSAALLGAAVAAEEVQIWTDVEGVLTADPRVAPAARPIAALTFAEAAELAAFGAKVLHPATIQPAVEADVPVTVRHAAAAGPLHLDHRRASQRRR